MLGRWRISIAGFVRTSADCPAVRLVPRMIDPLTDSHHDEPLETVRTFPNEAEASIAQGLLKDAGILSFVQGGQSSAAFSNLGIAIAGVPLQVPRFLAAEASEVLTDRLRATNDVPEWICPNCQSEVDAGFAVCWQCGREYPANEENQPDGNSPVATVGTASSSATHDVASDDRPYEDELANQALRTALFGILFPPLNILAFVFVVRCWEKRLSPDGIGKLLGTFLLIWFSSTCWKIALSALFSQFE